MARLIVASLGMIVDGLPFESTKKGLSATRHEDGGDFACFNEEEYFGKNFENLKICLALSITSCFAVNPRPQITGSLLLNLIEKENRGRNPNLLGSD